jgi:hypothetical protein
VRRQIEEADERGGCGRRDNDLVVRLDFDEVEEFRKTGVSCLYFEEAEGAVH